MYFDIILGVLGPYHLHKLFLQSLPSPVKAEASVNENYGGVLFSH